MNDYLKAIAAIVIATSPLIAQAQTTDLHEEQRMTVYRASLARVGIQASEINPNGISRNWVTLMAPVSRAAAYFLAPSGYFLSRPERLVFQNGNGAKIECGLAMIFRQDADSPLHVQIGNCTGSPDVQKLTTEQLIRNGATQSGPIIDMLVDTELSF